MKHIEKYWKSIDVKPELLFFESSVVDVLIAPSDAPWCEGVDSRLEIAVRALKVCFVNDLLLHKNFGPNVVFENLDLWFTDHFASWMKFIRVLFDG